MTGREKNYGKISGEHLYSDRMFRAAAALDGVREPKGGFDA